MAFVKLIAKSNLIKVKQPGQDLRDVEIRSQSISEDRNKLPASKKCWPSPAFKTVDQRIPSWPSLN